MANSALRLETLSRKLNEDLLILLHQTLESDRNCEQKHKHLQTTTQNKQKRTHTKITYSNIVSVLLVAMAMYKADTSLIWLTRRLLKQPHV